MKTSTTIIVRTALPSDLNIVGQEGYLRPEIIGWKIEAGDIFIAECDGEPIGYLRLEYLWSKLPYIELIRVIEPYRRSGVGRALLTYVESTLSSRGYSVLYSSSQADEPEPQAWHRRMGFDECGLIAGVNEGGIGEIFFRKRLQ